MCAWVGGGGGKEGGQQRCEAAAKMPRKKILLRPSNPNSFAGRQPLMTLAAAKEHTAREYFHQVVPLSFFLET